MARAAVFVLVGTVIGIAAFVEAGGVVLGVTWVGAGLAAHLESRSGSPTGGRLAA